MIKRTSSFTLRQISLKLPKTQRFDVEVVGFVTSIGCIFFAVDGRDFIALHYSRKVRRYFDFVRWDLCTMRELQ